MGSEVKAPILKILEFASKSMPEPTKQNTIKPNSWVLIEIRDEFLKRCVPAGKVRVNAYKALWNILISIYEYDEPYQDFLDWVIKQIVYRKDDWRDHGLVETQSPYKVFWEKEPHHSYWLHEWKLDE